MASFMNSVNKGIAAFSMKTSNFTEITKCKTYISTMEAEIDKLKSDMGNVMYEMHKVGDKDYAKLENFCVEIDRRYQTIETQKEKIRQMEDEEKQILGNAPAAQRQPAGSARNAVPRSPRMLRAGPAPAAR